jgi:PAS domain S-box-containing protein
VSPSELAPETEPAAPDAGKLAHGREPPTPPGWVVALGTAVAYAAVGGLALLLAGPPGYASALYPSAGLALAAVLVWGAAALPGVAMGSFAVNLMLGALRSPDDAPTLLLPLAIGLGAMAQAAFGAWLVRRFVAQPLSLAAPRDVLRFGLLGAFVACAVSASVGTAALVGSGTVPPAMALDNWATWWAGDTLGVLIGAPVVLTLIGRPRSDWAPRRLTVGLPLTAAALIAAAALVLLDRNEAERAQARFDRDTDRITAALDARLRGPLHALQALHGAAQVANGLDEAALRSVAAPWLAEPMQLQAMGYSVLVPRGEVAAFEAAARAAGQPQYRVFERNDGVSSAADPAVLALREIEPREGNAAALGVNTLSIPAARAAVLQAAATGSPAATAGFRLTQTAQQEIGIVVYRALYRGGVDPGDAAAREAALAGVVFVTLRMQRTLEGLIAPYQTYIDWCLLDTPAEASAALLAGAPACMGAPEAWRKGLLTAVRRLPFGGREVELRLTTDVQRVPNQSPRSVLLTSVAGMAAAALLGALLLIVTGATRRTERAVASATGALRREIGERAQVQQALAQSEARLRSIVDNVPTGVMFMDPAGRILDANPHLLRLLQHTRAALVERSLGELAHPQDMPGVVEDRQRLLRGQNEVVRRQMRLATAGGGWLTVQGAATALRGPDGRVQRVVAVLEDISERLRLQASEQALREAEAASRAKSDFVSRMSHELRTPLNAMIGFSQLLGLDRDPALAPHQREWVQHILRAGWHLLEMINETLDLARIEAGAVQLHQAPTAVQPLAEGCRSMVAASAQARGVTLHEEIAHDAASVVADPLRLKQVLLNLLSNAVKYNREGGSAVLRTRRVDEAWVEISVQDTGIGLSASQLDSLFQPFNRLGRENSGIEGTGIGLVISRRLAQLMGGELNVTSTPGEGSTFTLRLRHAETGADAAPQRGVLPSASYRERRIHYVEDNATNVEVMRGILAQRPQVTLEVSVLGLDGLGALRVQPPDLILLDMQLPDISGLELLRHLKNDDELAGIPVVVVSADATPGRMQEALTLGAAHYVTKPVDVGAFLALVDDLLAGTHTRFGS